jgi:tryptophan halogenase
LYLDCSGFRGVLINKRSRPATSIGRHAALRSRRCGARELAAARPPYTEASARAGWRRIPLQHRAGNGYVYSSAHIDGDGFTDLLTAAGEKPLADPRFLPS